MPLRSNNFKHKLKAQELRNVRKKAKLSQLELAKKLGISRELVSRIENYHLEQMENLNSDLQERWYEVCEPTLASADRNHFLDFIMRLYKKG